MKRWQWITAGTLAALTAAVAVGWATRQPLGRPGIYVNLNIPTWLAVAVFAVFVVRLGWELYRGQAILDDLDRTSDDADLAARTVARHDEELDDIREWIAAVAPQLTDVLDTHRTLAAGPGTPPVVVEVIQPVEEPVQPEPTQPEIPAQPKRPKPLPGPTTTPDGLPANRGVKRARLTAAADVDRATAEAGFEHDVEYARVLADLDDQMWGWAKYRESLEWAKP